MPDRELTISTASRHDVSKWKQEITTWQSLAERLNSSREIPSTPEEFAKLTDAEQRELKNGPCYVFGALDHTGKRQKGHLSTREGLTYDLDSIDRETLNSVLRCLTESGYNYVCHSSASYDGQNAKVRVIIPFSQPIKPKEYSAKAKAAASIFGIPLTDDACSFEDTHLFYFPTHLKGVHPIYEACVDGEYLDPGTLKASEMPLESLSTATAPCIKEAVRTIKFDYLTATDTVRKYESRDRENLQNRDNYVSALLVLVQATLTGEISQHTGETCAVLLAGDREDWKENNRQHFLKELKNTKPRTTYSFMEKFGDREISAAEDFTDVSKQVVESTFRVVRMDTVTPKPIQWLYYPYLAIGCVTIISGDGGTGKSSLTAAIASAITRGTPLPGELNIERKPGVVLYQNSEDLQEEVQRPRLEASMADLNKILFLQPIDPYGKQLGFDKLEEIEPLLQEYKPILCIFDPIQAFFNEEQDMNSMPCVRGVMQSLAEFAKRNQLAIILIAHNKKQQDKALLRLIGSSDFANAARSILSVLNNPKDNTEHFLFHTKTNIGPVGDTIPYKTVSATIANPNPSSFEDTSIQTSIVEWGDPLQMTEAQFHAKYRADEEKPGEQIAREAILNELEAAPVLSSDLCEICMMLGATKANYDAVANLLVQEGLISKRKLKKGEGSRAGAWITWLRGRDICLGEDDEMHYTDKEDDCLAEQNREIQGDKEDNEG
ncbi:MAG: AAA family ATPase [Clostridiales bacterium]|nr:AAA family ATPase [Clostridiales bacterium]